MNEDVHRELSVILNKPEIVSILEKERIQTGPDSTISAQLYFRLQKNVN
jgi:hypothetical protein